MAKRDAEVERKDAELRSVFSKHVLARAKKKDMSINKLADFAGVDRGHLSKLLREHKSPTIRTIAALSIALACEPWELLKK